MKNRADRAVKIIVVGSINCDITTYISDFPKPNETIMAQRTAVSVGGKGLNQAVAAARAGAQVAMVACIGNDQFGRQALDYLKENDVSVEFITCREEAVTGSAAIFVTRGGENMIAVSPGANAELTPDLVEAARDAISSADIVIVQMEIPLNSIKKALEIARKEEVTTILNPAPANSGAISLLPLVDIVTPNETESEMLVGINPVGEESTGNAVKAFHQLGADGVIITRGEDGCAVSIGGTRADLGAFKIETVDPTGAGDVFNGVLAVGLARKYSPEKAARMASAAAAISVTRPMAEGAAPFASEIEEFLARYPADL